MIFSSLFAITFLGMCVCVQVCVWIVQVYRLVSLKIYISASVRLSAWVHVHALERFMHAYTHWISCSLYIENMHSTYWQIQRRMADSVNGNEDLPSLHTRYPFGRISRTCKMQWTLHSFLDCTTTVYIPFSFSKHQKDPVVWFALCCYAFHSKLCASKILNTSSNNIYKQLQQSLCIQRKTNFHVIEMQLKIQRQKQRDNKNKNIIKSTGKQMSNDAVLNGNM